MKNIQVVDGAENTVYDIFQATDDEFALIFPNGTDIAFNDELGGGADTSEINAALTKIWERRIPKVQALGIHGIIFYGLEEKKVYYPTRRDEEAVNPDGSRLR